MSEGLDDRFITALLGEDELGVVIRTHTYIEARLTDFIEIRLEEPKHLKGWNLSYAEKIKLACALGFDERYQSAFKKIGEIRNKFAHNLSMSLDKKVISELYSTLPAPGKEAVIRSLTSVQSKLSPPKKEKFEDQAPRDRFVLIAITMERLLVAAKLMLERRPTTGTQTEAQNDQALNLSPPGR